MDAVKNFVKLPTAGFNPVRKGDLLYQGMPLLVHFVNQDDEYEHYLYKWTDCDEVANRWLAFKVSEKDLLSFFKKELTLRQLIDANSFVYFVDIDNDLNTIQTLLVPTADIPQDYLPFEDSFYEELHYEAYAATLIKYLFEKSTVSQKNDLLAS